jgi:catechol 2,3-dioxygenase
VVPLARLVLTALGTSRQLSYDGKKPEREDAMALKGVLRPGYIQIRVTDLAAAIRHYVDRIGLREVGREADGRTYLRAYDEFDRHSVVLREAAEPGMDYVGFKVASEDELGAFGRRIAAFGVEVVEIPAGEQPGVGRRLSFIVPTGHRIELFAEMALSENGPMIRNPELWQEEPHGMRVTRFDHCNLHGPNIDATVKFFTEVLDFSLSEAAQTPDGIAAAFLTCSNKAHDIAFIRRDEPGKFHHAAFWLDSWHEVGQAADIIARYDIPLDIGPTRHGITRGQTIYFFDPSGNRNEVFSGGFIYYPDNPQRVWSIDNIGKAVFYYQRELNPRFMSVVT